MMQLRNGDHTFSRPLQKYDRSDYVSVSIDRTFMILFALSLVTSTSFMLLRPKDDAVTEWGSHF